MNPMKEKISQALREKQRAISLQDLAKILQLTSSGEFKILVKACGQMEKEGSIIFTKKGKIRLPKAEIYLEGTLRLNDRGFGFVTYDPEEEDIYVPKEDINNALDGDLVEVDIVQPADPFLEKGAQGVIKSIKKRHMENIVGEFLPYSEDLKEESGYLGYLIPKEKKLQQYKVFVLEMGLHPVEGNIVTVSISQYPNEDNPSFTGVVTQILGHKNDPGMDILSLVTSLGIETKFPKAVLEQAEKTPEVIDPKELVNRVDRRDQLIVTIDGAEAKDLDDAVTVKKLDNGNFFLGVHIADVSHYVTENSPMDQEAYLRGTSIYLTDRVIPMLPQRLSNGICSLNPNVDRLTLSCEMEINLEGKVVSYAIFPSVIKTVRRMTYTAVNEILEDKDPMTRKEYDFLVPMFEDMAELHHILETMRQKRGAISFEDREAKILVDEKGHPEEIVLRERGLGEKMIESFMLAANETVAYEYESKHLPFIYRIHEAPKEEKLTRFFDFASLFGLKIHGTKKNISPKDLQDIIKSVKDKPEAPVISTMLLRSMQQAKYSEDNLGHYGLGAEYYTHFTSPIRRYPDLMVHRLIHYYAHPNEEKTAQYALNLPDIAQQASTMERKAVDAERMVDSMKKAEFLQDHVGEVFPGVISSVTKFGLFVELENTIEGLVHISNLPEDYFHFIEGKMSLVGERTGAVYRLGQKVSVKVIKADPVLREIDFELVRTSKDNENKAGRSQRKGHYKGNNQRSSKGSHSHKGRGKEKTKNYSKASSEKSSEKPFAKKGKKKKKNDKPFYKGVKGKKKKR